MLDTQTLPLVTQSIDVAVTPEQMLAVILDYARYPEFIPEVKSIRVEPRGDGRVAVTYQLDAKLFQVDYTLEHVQVSPSKIEWRLLRGELLRANSGSWTLEPTATGTRAIYAIALSVSAMPASFQRALSETGLPRLLANFKARAESLAQAR